MAIWLADQDVRDLVEELRTVGVRLDSLHASEAWAHPRLLVLLERIDRRLRTEAS